MNPMAWFLGRTRPAAANLAILHAREHWTPDAFFDRCYAGSGMNRERVIELLKHIAAELRLPVGQLRPEDRFTVELSPGTWNMYDSGYAMLVHDLTGGAAREEKSSVIPLKPWMITCVQWQHYPTLSYRRTTFPHSGKESNWSQ